MIKKWDACFIYIYILVYENLAIEKSNLTFLTYIGKKRSYMTTALAKYILIVVDH